MSNSTYALSNPVLALKRILSSLPKRRDWLDPEVEQFARDCVEDAEMRARALSQAQMLRERGANCTGGVITAVFEGVMEAVAKARTQACPQAAEAVRREEAYRDAVDRVMASVWVRLNHNYWNKHHREGDVFPPFGGAMPPKR